MQKIWLPDHYLRKPVCKKRCSFELNSYLKLLDLSTFKNKSSDPYVRFSDLEGIDFSEVTSFDPSSYNLSEFNNDLSLTDFSNPALNPFLRENDLSSFDLTTFTNNDVNPFVRSDEIDDFREITVYTNYSAFPDPTLNSDTFAFAENSEGTKFIGALWGGVYFPAGLYWSSGTEWKYMDTPSQATQTEVNTGTNTNKFLTPATFTNSSLITSKEDSANKDASGGYAGLTLFKINFKNVANTFTSFFTNSNTAARTYTFPDYDGTVVMRDGTTTLTNKRITARTGTVTSSATPTINTDNVDFYSITALAAAITSFTTNLSGTPTEGQTLWIAITDDGTARAITWGASFESSTISLPTTTLISTRLDVAFIWNTVTSKWRCVGKA